MENDQIKAQMENAKRAFVASKARDHDTSSEEAERNEAMAQEVIMGHLHQLMEEAAQTRRGPVGQPELQSKPFWAQNKIDIPPSEQFGKRQKMNDKEKAGTDDQLAATAKPGSAEMMARSELGTDPLTAIRQEVFNKLGDTAGSAEELQQLTNRIQNLESRAEKQQQDLTALLKLVRQLANRQSELEQDTTAPQRQRGIFGPLILILIVMLGGIAGWLLWLDPDMMLAMSASALNNSFDAVLNLIARFGLL